MNPSEGLEFADGPAHDPGNQQDRPQDERGHHRPAAQPPRTSDDQPDNGENREPRGAPFLGAAQVAWLKEQLAANRKD